MKGDVMKKFFKSIGLATILFAGLSGNFSGANANAGTDPRVEKAVTWALEIASDPVHGYSQGAENATYRNPYTGSREGPDYDCSALVYHAYTHGGFDIISVWQKYNPKYFSRYGGRQYSGDADTIWEDLQKLGGFTKYSWSEIKNNLKRGDILCYPKHHVAIYVGDGWTVEARGVNNPTGRGRYETGDQGGEIDCYGAQGRGWTEVYRYTGK